MAAFATDQRDTYAAWLYNAQGMLEHAQRDGIDLRFFAALQVDARGEGPFQDTLLAYTREAGLADSYFEYWTYSLDDGRTEVTTANRLRHLTVGQNLATRYSLDAGCSHMLFLAADCAPPGDAIPKLLELDHPIVGGEVTTYCLHGEPVPGYPFPVQSHMATAAFVMLRRDLLKRVHWRYDVDSGMTDDPCLHADALALGYPTYVRKDCIGKHYPESIGAIETRGHDMRVYR